MPLSETDGWKIFVGDTLLGTAYHLHLDFPWIICTFESTPAFKDYQPIFD